MCLEDLRIDTNGLPAKVRCYIKLALEEVLTRSCDVVFENMTRIWSLALVS
jgi:hypothetical protein